MHKPCEGHWSAAKRVLRYLKGTQDIGLKYSKVDDFKLIGYSNLDFDGDKETGVLTFGYTMSLGSTAVSWRSHSQFRQIKQQKQNMWLQLKQRKK